MIVGVFYYAWWYEFLIAKKQPFRNFLFQLMVATSNDVIEIINSCLQAYTRSINYEQ
jgi:hypothetical protein